MPLTQRDIHEASERLEVLRDNMPMVLHSSPEQPASPDSPYEPVELRQLSSRPDRTSPAWHTEYERALRNLHGAVPSEPETDEQIQERWVREWAQRHTRQYPEGSHSNLKWYCEASNGKVRVITGRYGEPTRKQAMKTTLRQIKEERVSVLREMNNYLSSIGRINKNIAAVSELLDSEDKEAEPASAEPASSHVTSYTREVSTDELASMGYLP